MLKSPLSLVALLVSKIAIGSIIKMAIQPPSMEVTVLSSA